MHPKRSWIHNLIGSARWNSTKSTHNSSFHLCCHPRLATKLKSPFANCTIRYTWRQMSFMSAFDWGQSISYSSKTSQQCNEYTIWMNLNNQSALHSLGGSETPQPWPEKFIHGRLGAYLAKHWEDILCVLESPATGGIGKLMNQVAKIQSLTIWSCFLSSFLKLSKILNLFNISTSKSLLSHHWIDGLSRWHRWILKEVWEVCNLDGFSEASWILASDSNLWLLSFDLEIWKMFEITVYYYGEENHETN